MTQNDLPALVPVREILGEHPFVVPKILQNYHTQTLLNRSFSHFKTKLPKVEKKYFRLLDGSQITADCFFQNQREKHPTIVILNGVNGSSKTYFSRTMSYKAFYSGFNVVCLMQRGEGDTVHLTDSLFAAYPHNDLPLVLKEIHAMGLQEVYLVGLSFGGWSALLTLGMKGRGIEQYLSGVIAISPPDNLLGSWNHMENFPLYSWLMLQVDKKYVKNRSKIDPSDTWDLKKLRKIRTKKEFFDTYLATHTVGSPDKKVTVEEYSQKTDIVPLLDTITIPTLIIHSYDDPVCSINPFLHLKNPYIITLFSKYGGHGGFFTTKKLYGDLDGLWAQNRAMEFIRLLKSR